MATKKLERSIMEGGRAQSDKISRRACSRRQRAAARRYAQEVKAGLDPESDRQPGPARRVDRRVYDKLSPPERWLAAQVGRPWLDIDTQLERKLDLGSVKGRHLYEHMQPWWGWESLEKGWEVGPRLRFRVDVDGRLRAVRMWRPRTMPPIQVRQETLNWMGERRVAQRRKRYFWLVPAREPVWTGSCYFLRDLRPVYRQHVPLTRAERKRLRKLNRVERALLVRRLE